MHPQNFMIFGTYKLNNAENEMMLSLCHYVNSYLPEGATNMTWVLSICIIAVLLSLLLHWNSAFFFEFITKIAPQLFSQYILDTTTTWLFGHVTKWSK